ncbi:MAG: oligoribonuclease [Gammaproteobacteria bacterium]|nr:oligoribonuclease [Gammaproteobacteria bacterium]MBP9729557.1 oligoribonuclease [Gammaproteobacteria bacterium]
MKAKDPKHLIWIDLEMTGLNPDHDRILEIATVLTDKALNIVAEGPVFTILQDEALLTGMDAWNTKHHTKSGLLDRVRKQGVSESHAEAQTLAFLAPWVDAQSSPMCGSTIGQDRRFLYRYMPQLEAYFHYRNLDVSTVKELAKYWKPHIVSQFKKKSAHLAMEDVKESIDELKFYHQNFFNLDS